MVFVVILHQQLITTQFIIIRILIQRAQGMDIEFKSAVENDPVVVLSYCKPVLDMASKTVPLLGSCVS